MTAPTPKQQASLERYKAFWERRPVERPLVGFGFPYPAKHLRQNRELQKRKGPITPDMIRVDEFMPSYEEWFAKRSQFPGDLLYTVEPPNGLPWVEAMAGCGVVASGQGYSALRFAEDADGLDRIAFDLDSPWARKYFEFYDALNENFAGRCGVGQPIFRGISDLLAAVLGPENMVFAMNDEPERVKAFIKRATDFYVELTREQMRRTRPFLGGYQIGFYDIWAPEPCVWLQDDNLVLFSAEMYREFFHPFIETVTGLTPYNMIHLHPVCFHQLDLLLSTPTLGVAEVNREMIEQSFSEAVMPQLKRIQEVKLLDVQGMFTVEELRETLETLSPVGLQIKCLVEDPDYIPLLWDEVQRHGGK